VNRYVIDASVAVKWFIADAADEANTDHALLLLDRAQQGDAKFLAPPHWVSEVAAVLVRLTPKTVSRSVAALRSLSFVTVANEDSHYQHAISLSLKLDHHLFDTLYHAIALEENATLITADKKYYDKARRLGSIVMLAEFEG
jgi:predicted nucleic acid-binding protein